MDSASIKIERATEHIGELNELFRKGPPFTYALETNTKTGECATFAKKNEPVLNRTALIVGDVIHNLRSALDHVYWDIVGPFATTDWERRSVQFPFSETEDGLEKAVKNRLADRVSEEFFSTVINLRPYGEPSGNRNLYAIHALNILDKHKLLIPMGDYTRISSHMLIGQAPGFPPGLSNCGFGQNRRDVAWRIKPMTYTQRRKAKITGHGILEKELNVPVDIVLPVTGYGPGRSLIPSLHQFADVVRETVAILRSV